MKLNVKWYTEIIRITKIGLEYLRMNYFRICTNSQCKWWWMMQEPLLGIHLHSQERSYWLIALVLPFVKLLTFCLTYNDYLVSWSTQGKISAAVSVFQPQFCRWKATLKMTFFFFSFAFHWLLVNTRVLLAINVLRNWNVTHLANQNTLNKKWVLHVYKVIRILLLMCTQ